MQKIILITGSTDGIGKMTAKMLAEKGNIIIIHGRNEQKCIDTINEIKSLTNNNQLDYVVGDLSEIKAVKNLADLIISKYEKLDVLINNAGIYSKEQLLTIDKIESTFAVNHIAVFVLTGMLMPLLKKSNEGRIVNVASLAHTQAKLDLDDYNLEREFNHRLAYSNSKLANILFTYYLADKLSEDKITVNCLHPGVIGTKLLKLGYNMKGASLEDGAETSVYLAVSDEVKNITGKYFTKKAEVPTSKVSYNKTLQLKLWELSEKLTGMRY